MELRIAACAFVFQNLDMSKNQSLKTSRGGAGARRAQRRGGLEVIRKSDIASGFLPITSIFTTEDTEFHGGKGRIRTKTPCFSKLSNGQQYSVVNSSCP